jgi:folate-binding protein YgfZ
VIDDLWVLPPMPWRFSYPVTLIHLQGQGCLRLLHGQTTQALLDLTAGQKRSTCFVNATAWLGALAEVTATDGGAELLVTAGCGVEIHRALDRVIFPADQVQLQAPLPLRWHGLVDRNGSLNGAGWGLPGYHWLLKPNEPLPKPLEQLKPLDQNQQEWLRYRQGIPADPGELNAGLNPFELGLREWVSLDKGCYLGQETLAKLYSRAGVKQQLRRWFAAAGTTPPQPGTSLMGPGGERAGTVSSCLNDFQGAVDRRGCWGLALLRRDWLESKQLVGLELSLPETSLFN